MALDDDDRARTREPFFTRALQLFAERVRPAELGCAYSLSDAAVLSRAYFLLNRDYKRWRLDEERNTKPTKIAALKIAAVMAVRPFYSPAGEELDAVFFSNTLFAVACAEALLGADVLTRTDDHLRRLSMILDRMRFPMLDELLRDAEAGERKSLYAYEARLSVEEVRNLDLLVTLCELAAPEIPITD